MFYSIQKRFATQHVYVQMLTAFYTNFRFHFHRNFTVFNVTQFAHSNDFIFGITGFCTNTARFAFFAVEQPERVQQIIVCRFSNLDTRNHDVPPLGIIFDLIGLVAANW